MNRGLLALGTAIVLALGIGLYLALGSDDGAVPHTAADPPQKNPEPGPGKNRIAPRMPGSDAARDRRAGQLDIRDHRTGAPPPDEALPPPAPAPVRPPDGRQIDRKITGDLSRQLRPLVASCTAGVAPDAHGTKARIEGQLIVAIKAGQATVSSASFELRDVADAVQPGIKQCLVEHIVGLAAPAGAESDLDNYPIALSMSWP